MIENCAGQLVGDKFTASYGITGFLRYCTRENTVKNTINDATNIIYLILIFSYFSIFYELCLLPLNGSRRLAGDVVGHTGDPLHLVDDTAGYQLQKLERQMGKSGGHKVDGLYRPQ